MNSVQAELSSARLFTESNTVLSCALDARQRGWSVIPLKGGINPQSGKHPKIAWQTFQQKRAGENQLEAWFAEGTSAYGVVCGLISNLIVIDFDEEEAQAEFIQRFPHLMKTYIVKSGLRRTLHIYLRVDFPMPSCKIRGGDLKVEGTYVVGSGSQIAEGLWEVINDVPVRSISRQELDEVLEVFGKSSACTIPQTFETTGNKLPDYCISLYRALVKQLQSRNEALFRVGCYMRDAGYALADTLAVLSYTHVSQAPISKHPRETDAQRLNETHRTLQSVFTRPARSNSRNSSLPADASYVPNHLREAILQYQDGTAFLRVYEGLMLIGKSVGQAVREREIMELLSKYGIGRPTVRKALKFSLTPFPGTHPHAEADLTVAESHTNTCVFVPTTKADKNRGRPAQYYLIPSIESLCDLFGVESKGADPIALNDIHSAKSYRSALNRELIRRRSGKYSQEWLGNRLSVTSRTIQRYIKLERIQSLQILHETPLDWHNVEYIPTPTQAKRAGFSIQPYFLQDENGKRYPPKQMIAKKLLKQKQRVSLMRRDCNFYWCEDLTQSGVKLRPDPIERKAERRFKLPQYQTRESIHLPATEMPIEVPCNAEPESSQAMVATDKSQSSNRRSDRYYKKPLPDLHDEWFAQKVYCCAENLQEVEARQLVDQYGKQAVGQALGRMEYLRVQGRLRNPAGFMKVACCVAWKATHADDAPVPNYHVPKRRKGRSTYKDQKKDPLFQSQSYLEWRSHFLGEDVWEYPLLEAEISF